MSIRFRVEEEEGQACVCEDENHSIPGDGSTVVTALTLPNLLSLMLTIRFGFCKLSRKSLACHKFDQSRRMGRTNEVDFATEYHLNFEETF